MQELERVQELTVVQKKEWGEILTDFEQRNKYRIFAPDGQEMFRALESGGALLARLFLRSWRPFENQLRSMLPARLLAATTSARITSTSSKSSGCLREHRRRAACALLRMAAIG